MDVGTSINARSTPLQEGDSMQQMTGERFLPDAKTQRAIDRIRAAISEGDWSIDQAIKGADTELMVDVKKLEEQPLHLAEKSIEGHAAALTQFFTTFVNKVGLSDFVHSGSYKISGSKVNLRVFLKTQSWNYDTRSLFFSLVEHITESRFFAGLTVNLLLLKENDPEPLSTTYQKLPL